jgi:predicted site-specific integrase-resolvase
MKKYSDFVSGPAFAKLIGVTPATVTKWTKAGKIPCIKHPMNDWNYLYDPKDAEKIMNLLEKKKQ